jgi:phosphohistidine phosphatase SixA
MPAAIRAGSHHAGMIHRRPLLALPLWAWSGARADDRALIQVLRAGGVAVLVRHAVTEPGIGDPPGMQIGRCSTQRNLSEEGKAQSRRMGAWFDRRGLKPAAVRSSEWCRCVDTAQLAFGQVERWPALNSFFGDRSGEPAQTVALRAALGAIPAGRFEVWVTHQVNISALTGEGTAMGEALVAAAPAGSLEVRGRFSPA